MTAAALALCLVQAATPAGEAAAEVAADLPPEGCVRLLREARVALEGGERTGAWSKLVEALESYPDEVAPVLAVLEHHEALELAGETTADFRGRLIRWLADAERKLPEPVLEYLVGNPHTDEASLEAALPHLQVRLERSPHDAALLRSVAAVHSRLDRPEAARETLGRLYEVAPDKELARECARLDVELERWAQAAAMLERVLDRDDEPPMDARVAYVEVLARMGRTEDLAGQVDAIVADLRVESLREALARPLLAAAWGLRDAGKPADAERMFRKVLELEADNAEARAALLHLYASEQERRAHAAALNRHLAEEDDPQTLLDEGAALLAAGNASGAIDLLERAAAGRPDSEAAWFNLGLAADRLQRWEVADRALARAAALNPERAETFLHRGAALQHLGRYDEAVAQLQRALELGPELTQAHYWLYHCHRELGNDGAARRSLEAYTASQ